MKKRVITLLVILAVLLCGIMPTYAAGFTDTVGKPSEDSVSLLSSLGLVEGKAEGLFEPDSKLTRAEMATIIMRTMGVDASTGADIFSDVPSSHWAYKNIAAAYKIGIISGVSANTFAPDATLTYAQAVKMIVCALGFDVHAQNMGGYPTGYLTKASQLNLLKGVTQANDDEITRGTMAIILANALDVNLLQKTSFGNEANKYEEVEGVTLLTKYLKINKYEGKITANYLTTLNDLRSSARDEVILGGISFKVGKTNAAQLIGREVTIYSQIPDGSATAEIKAIIEDKNVSVIKIDADDILPKTTAGMIYYEASDSGKEQSADLNSNATLVYNGKVFSGWNADNLKPATGTVTLISNDADYDVIFVDEFKNYVVSSTLSEDNKVYFKDSIDITELVIDINDKSIRTEFTNTDGTAAVVDDCAEWDVLSVTKSLDGKTLKVVRSNTNVTGKVQEVGIDEVIINDTTYKVASNLISNIKVGDSAAYYLDFNGKIVVANTEYDTDGKYGYLVNAEPTKGIDSYPELKIFTQDGEMKIFATTNKVLLNGINVEKANLINNALISNGGQVTRQLIKFRTNEAGDKVNQIDVVGTGDNAIKKDLFINSARKGEYFDTEDKKVITAGEVMFIGGTLRMFMTKYLVRDETIVFVVPDADAPDKDYYIKPAKTLTHGNDGDKYINTTLYDTDDDQVVGAMVWDQSVTGGSATYPAYTESTAIITDITKGINEDGEILTNIKMFNWSGKEVTLTVESDYKEVRFLAANTNKNTDPLVNGGALPDLVDVSALNPGDVVQYIANAKNEATTLSVIFRAQTPGMYEMSISGKTRTQTLDYLNYRGGLLTGYGPVLNVSEYGILTKVYQYDPKTFDKNSTVFNRMYVFAGRMLEYDMEKKTIKTITADEFHEDDMVLSLWRTNSQMMLIKYKNNNKK